MSEYAQIFLGPPETELDRLIDDVEAATGLALGARAEPPGGYWGGDGERAVLLISGTSLDDEPDLPFSTHPFKLEFYTSEQGIESERRFLDDTFRRLRGTGRYSLFATLDVQVRIDPV